MNPSVSTTSDPWTPTDYRGAACSLLDAAEAFAKDPDQEEALYEAARQFVISDPGLARINIRAVMNLIRDDENFVESAPIG